MNQRVITRIVASLAFVAAAWGAVRIFAVDSASVMFAVLGGIVASFAFEAALALISWIDYLWNRRLLCKTFGKDVFDKEFRLVYSSFVFLPDARQVLQKADKEFCHIAVDEFLLPGKEISAFRVDEALASHDVQALAMLAKSLVESGGKPQIVRAVDVAADFDCSFIAFGLGGSKKSKQLLSQLERFGYILKATPTGHIDLYDTSTNKIVAVGDEKAPHIGYLIRLHPKQHPDRTWILCAGVGPIGTVAASLYLAQQYTKINAAEVTVEEKLGDRPCLIVIRSDEFPGSALADRPIPLKEVVP